MPEYFIINKKTNRIVNAVITQKSPAEVEALFRDDVKAVTDPSDEQLEQYRYYWERP